MLSLKTGGSDLGPHSRTFLYERKKETLFPERRERSQKVYSRNQERKKNSSDKAISWTNRMHCYWKPNSSAWLIFLSKIGSYT